MGTNTKIEWTDATWNPIIGCSRVSEGCRHCYAETIAGRFGNGKETVYSGLTHIVNGRAVWTGQIKETKKLLEPLSWRTPKRVFVNSMSDLFHENVTDEMRDKIFAVMAVCPHHTFQVLTKRPERMLAYCSDDSVIRRLAGASDAIAQSLGGRAELRVWNNPDGLTGVCLPNVWLGVSVENQAAADERIPLLLNTPAALRFISAEPLLGSLDLRNLRSGTFNALDGIDYEDITAPGSSARPRIGWVICGGESGHEARPMHPDWARSLRDQCQAAGVPFFFKQWGEWGPAENGEIHVALRGHIRTRGETVIAADAPMRRDGKKAAGAVLDGREWKQFPEGALMMNYPLASFALELADEYSISVIEGNGVPIKSKSGALLWYEVDPNKRYSWQWVERAIRYLEMRGKLRRRSSNRNHVKAVRQ